MTPRRNAGLSWRLLVHAAPTVGGDGMNGTAHHIESSKMHQQIVRRFRRHKCGPDAWQTHQVIPDAEFDELVVDRWLHIEQMDTNYWWMNIGGVTLHVTADRQGRPIRVSVDMPGQYDHPADGCTYRLDGVDYPTGEDLS